MKTKSLFFLLFIFLLTACESEKDVNVCLVNGSGHALNFWAYDNRDHLVSVGPSYCSSETPGYPFSWRAQYPSQDPIFIFAEWVGVFTVENEDTDFVFKGLTDSLTYDFRDSIVGPYTMICEELELAGTDTISAFSDTRTATLSKSLPLLTQLTINIDSFYVGTATFVLNTIEFNLPTGSKGNLVSDKLSFSVDTPLPNGHILRKICDGKKD
jgi:hypothetical protein